MQLNLNHFEAALLFALFTSVVFAITTKNTDRERLHYGLWTFLAFIAVIFGAGWLMALVR
jgi:hypothetical protein